MYIPANQLPETTSAYQCAMRAKSLGFVIHCANAAAELPEKDPRQTSIARGWRFAAILRLMRQGYSHADASAVVDAGVVL